MEEASLIVTELDKTDILRSIVQRWRVVDAGPITYKLDS